MSFKKNILAGGNSDEKINLSKKAIELLGVNIGFPVKFSKKIRKSDKTKQDITYDKTFFEFESNTWFDTVGRPEIDNFSGRRSYGVINVELEDKGLMTLNIVDANGVIDESSTKALTENFTEANVTIERLAAQTKLEYLRKADPNSGLESKRTKGTLEEYVSSYLPNLSIEAEGIQGIAARDAKERLDSIMGAVANPAAPENKEVLDTWNGYSSEQQDAVLKQLLLVSKYGRFVSAKKFLDEVAGNSDWNVYAKKNSSGYVTVLVSM